MNSVLRTVPSNSQTFPRSPTTGYAGKPALFPLINSHMSFKTQFRCSLMEQPAYTDGVDLNQKASCVPFQI